MKKPIPALRCHTPIKGEKPSCYKTDARKEYSPPSLVTAESSVVGATNYAYKEKT